MKYMLFGSVKLDYTHQLRYVTVPLFSRRMSNNICIFLKIKCSRQYYILFCTRIVYVRRCYVIFTFLTYVVIILLYISIDIHVFYNIYDGYMRRQTIILIQIHIRTLVASLLCSVVISKKQLKFLIPYDVGLVQTASFLFNKKYLL